MGLKEPLAVFLRGILMGIADIIPGVSGGTIALITGIYERLVKAIDEINVLVIRHLLRKNFLTALGNIRSINFPFLLPLLIGISISFLSLSRLISILLTFYAPLTYAFFSGLIFSSAIVIFSRIGRFSLVCLAFLVIGLLFGFWLVGLTSMYMGHSLPVIFLSGSLAICAMILPGISGAFILLLLNQYEYMIEALHYLLLDRIISFLAGAIIGILSFVRLLEILLKKWRRETFSFLVGLMIGSLRRPLQVVISNKGYFIPSIISGLIGIVIVVLLESVSKSFFNHKDNVS